MAEGRAVGSLYLGTAGWSLPREQWPHFPAAGTHLQRYAARLFAVEINSSFYRAHRPATYVRWADGVPPGFRFSVKVPRQITHEARLIGCEALLEAFLQECGHLGEKLGCLLVQLPPSLAYEPDSAEAFFGSLRARHGGFVAFEPRHPSWLEAEPLLQRMRVARVAADPAPFAEAGEPAGWAGMRYYRLHGSPRVYYSSYEPDWLERLDARLAEAPSDVPQWCIFDNTASGAATANALALDELRSGDRHPHGAVWRADRVRPT
ncbi:DUF72 domain-containing protein [Stutzerimonas marianensis]